MGNLLTLEVPPSPNPKEKTIHISSQEQEVIQISSQDQEITNISSQEDIKKTCIEQDGQPEADLQREHKRKDPPIEPDRPREEKRQHKNEPQEPQQCEQVIDITGKENINNSLIRQQVKQT